MCSGSGRDGSRAQEGAGGTQRGSVEAAWQAWGNVWSTLARKDGSVSTTSMWEQLSAAQPSRRVRGEPPGGPRSGARCIPATRRTDRRQYDDDDSTTQGRRRRPPVGERGRLNSAVDRWPAPGKHRSPEQSPVAVGVAAPAAAAPGRQRCPGEGAGGAARQMGADDGRRSALQGVSAVMPAMHRTSLPARNMKRKESPKWGDL